MLLVTRAATSSSRVGRSLLSCAVVRSQFLMAAEQASAPVRRIRIYTKTGDKGTSSLFNGTRGPKDNAFFNALGTTDELNAAVGVAREHCLQANISVLADRLAEVQSRLLDLGTAIATPKTGSSDAMLERAAFPEESVETLEQWIDEMDATLPALRNFILPGGGLASAQLHVARTICRRAERSVVPLTREHEVAEVTARFLNRLSDFLFVAARYASQASGREDTVWRKQSRKSDATAAAESAKTSAGAGTEEAK